jgi:hypothetical protein
MVRNRYQIHGDQMGRLRHRSHRRAVHHPKIRDVVRAQTSRGERHMRSHRDHRHVV